MDTRTRIVIVCVCVLLGDEWLRGYVINSALFCILHTCAHTHTHTDFSSGLMIDNTVSGVHQHT